MVNRDYGSTTSTGVIGHPLLLQPGLLADLGDWPTTLGEDWWVAATEIQKGVKNSLILHFQHWNQSSNQTLAGQILRWKINDPLLVGKDLSHPFLPATPCLRVGPLKGFLSWQGDHQGPSACLVHYFRNYRNTRIPSGVSPKALRSPDTAKNNWHKHWMCIC